MVGGWVDGGGGCYCCNLVFAITVITLKLVIVLIVLAVLLIIILLCGNIAFGGFDVLG